MPLLTQHTNRPSTPPRIPIYTHSSRRPQTPKRPARPPAAHASSSPIAINIPSDDDDNQGPSHRQNNHRNGFVNEPHQAHAADMNVDWRKSYSVFALKASSPSQRRTQPSEPTLQQFSANGTNGETNAIDLTGLDEDSSDSDDSEVYVVSSEERSDADDNVIVVSDDSRIDLMGDTVRGSAQTPGDGINGNARPNTNGHSQVPQISKKDSTYRSPFVDDEDPSETHPSPRYSPAEQISTPSHQQDAQQAQKDKLAQQAELWRKSYVARQAKRADQRQETNGIAPKSPVHNSTTSRNLPTLPKSRVESLPQHNPPTQRPSQSSSSSSPQRTAGNGYGGANNVNSAVGRNNQRTVPSSSPQRSNASSAASVPNRGISSLITEIISTNQPSSAVNSDFHHDSDRRQVCRTCHDKFGSSRIWRLQGPFCECNESRASASTSRINGAAPSHGRSGILSPNTRPGDGGLFIESPSPPPQYELQRGNSRKVDQAYEVLWGRPDKGRGTKKRKVDHSPLGRRPGGSSRSKKEKGAEKHVRFSSPLHQGPTGDTVEEPQSIENDPASRIATLEHSVDERNLEYLNEAEPYYVYFVAVRIWGAGLSEAQAKITNSGPFHTQREANLVASHEVRQPLDRLQSLSRNETHSAAVNLTSGWDYSYHENAFGLQTHRVSVGGFFCTATVRRDEAIARQRGPDCRAFPTHAFSVPRHIYIVHSVTHYEISDSPTPSEAASNASALCAPITNGEGGPPHNVDTLDDLFTETSPALNNPEPSAFFSSSPITPLTRPPSDTTFDSSTHGVFTVPDLANKHAMETFFQLATNHVRNRGESRLWRVELKMNLRKEVHELNAELAQLKQGQEDDSASQSASSSDTKADAVAVAANVTDLDAGEGRSETQQDVDQSIESQQQTTVLAEEVMPNGQHSEQDHDEEKWHLFNKAVEVPLEDDEHGDVSRKKVGTKMCRVWVEKVQVQGPRN